MLPFSFEWHWDLGHYIFFGAFYGVVTVLGLAVGYAFLKTFFQMMKD